MFACTFHINIPSGFWEILAATVQSPTPAEGLRGSYAAVRENASYSVVGRLPTAPSPSDLSLSGFITLATLANLAFASSQTVNSV